MSERPLLGAAVRVEDIEPLLDWLADGPRDIELQSFSKAAQLLGDWKSEAKKVERLLAGHNGRRGMHGPSYVPLASNDPGLMAVTRERLSQGLDVCDFLGLTQIVIHSPFTHWDHESLDLVPGRRDEKIATVRATLEPIVKRAEALAVEVVIENIEDRDPLIRKEIVDAFASPALKLSIDTGHAFCVHRISAAPAVDIYVRAAGNDLTHVHLTDGDGYGDRHWAIGDGAIPWRAVFGEFAKLDSNPRLIIEFRPNKYRNNADVVRSAQYLVDLGVAR